MISLTSPVKNDNIKNSNNNNNKIDLPLPEYEYELFIPCCSPYLALSSGACGTSIRASIPEL